VRGNFGEIDGKKVAFTDHAIERMVEMQVTPQEFKALISEPEDVYTSKKYPDAKCHRAGKYSVALREEADGSLVAITVLYGSLEDWCEAARDGKLGDRSLKPDTGIPRRRKSRE
jgi:hypothetical protein